MYFAAAPRRVRQLDSGNGAEDTILAADDQLRRDELLLAGEGNPGQPCMLDVRRFTMLDQILEGGERVPADSFGLVSDDRLEESPGESALQDHFCFAREQCSI